MILTLYLSVVQGRPPWRSPGTVELVGVSKHTPSIFAGMVRVGRAEWMCDSARQQLRNGVDVAVAVVVVDGFLFHSLFLSHGIDSGH